ncbi:MAG: type II toxin-antitoxin system ParD family antitoxin [Armatimonadetes bacterium]|nr:type II toxin-antitoxin system ParD family antitoxin [Armatimonadota bacterium]
MAVVNISLPDQMKDYIDERLSEGQFSSTSEYFRDLVREDQKRRAQERLEELLLVGLESGEPIDVTEEYIQQKRAELLARIKGSQKRGS